MWSRMSRSAEACPPATACSTGVMSRTSTAGSLAWARPGSAVSIRASEVRSPRNAEVKTSSWAPAVKSSDSTAERCFIRAAHSGVTYNHALERWSGDTSRKPERTVRSDAAVQQHPHDFGAARQGGRLHDRRGVRRKQQIRCLRQRRAEPGIISTVSEIPRPGHATGADAAPGHGPRDRFPEYASRQACSCPGSLAGAVCPLTSAMARERTCARIAPRSFSVAIVASIARRKCPSHRSASAGVIGRPSWRCLKPAWACSL